MSSIRRAWQTGLQFSPQFQPPLCWHDDRPRRDSAGLSPANMADCVYWNAWYIYMYIYSVLYIYIYNNEAAVVKLHLIMFWHCKLWVELWALTHSPPPHLSRNYFNDNGYKIKESTAPTPQMWQPSCFNSVLSVIYHSFPQNQSFFYCQYGLYRLLSGCGWQFFPLIFE